MNRSHTHDARFQSAHVETCQAGDGFHIQFFKHTLGNDQDKSGSVRGLRTVTGRDRSALSEDGLEPCEALRCRVAANSFVGVDDMGAFLALLIFVQVDFVDRDGGDAWRKTPAVDGCRRPEVAVQGEFILGVAGNVEVFGDGFGRESHAPIPIRVGFRNPRIRYDAPSAKWNGRHGFNSARQNAISDSGVDFCRRNGNGFQTGSAIAVDGHSGHFFGVQSH